MNFRDFIRIHLPAARADYAKLKKAGFPRAHAEAFLQVAESEKCVIMTRTPGKACEQLLAEGYDAKSFHIKGKSCNWGPMAGFVCLDPLLNKQGAAGGTGNLKSHFKSLTDVYEDYRTASAEHIGISQDRLAFLQTEKYISPRMIVSNPRILAGSAINDNISVDYLIVEVDTARKLWALYYNRNRTYGLNPGPLLTNQSERMLGQRLFSILETATPLDSRLSQEDVMHKFEIIHGIQRLHGPGIHLAGKNYEKILALVNPHPPYAGSEAYKNAITGDYDLFAVWPLLHRGYNSALDRRKAGMFASITKEHIFAHEHKQLGNISQRIFNIAQILNSVIMNSTPGSVKPNRVFHSDEGGRPGADALDLPAAAFVPNMGGNQGMFLIENSQQMKALVASCVYLGYVTFINAGWAAQLGEFAKLGVWSGQL